MDSPINKTLAEVMDRANARLEAIASVSRVNAMLAFADPALILPSPALGLIAMEGTLSGRLDPSHRLRSLGYAGPWGEVTLTALDPEFEVHPWRVEHCAWIDVPAAELRDVGGTSKMARGLELALVRDGGTPCAPGWVTFSFSGSAWMGWALESCIAMSGERALDSRSATESLTRTQDALPAAAWPSWHEIGALAEGLRIVRLPRELVRESHVSIQLHFPEPIPVEGEPSASANVALVWNSIAHVYPDPAEIATRVSQGRRQMVHTLSTRSAGPGWVPWAVDGAHPADDPGALAGTGSRNGGWSMHAGEEFRLAFVPGALEASAPGRRTASLSLVLTPTGRKRLDRDDQRLLVDFRITQGAAANQVPAGTAFELVGGSASFSPNVGSGRLLVETMCGSDGLPASLAELADMELVQSMFPTGRVRSVTDVMGAVRVRFGEELAFVDAWDLLRREPGEDVEPLAVRVRFTRSHRPATERRALIRACESFLVHYLGPTSAGAIRLVDVDAESAA